MNLNRGKEGKANKNSYEDSEKPKMNWDDIVDGQEKEVELKGTLATSTKFCYKALIDNFRGMLYRIKERE